MRTAVLGTGEVCRVLAPALLAAGHQVAVGTRDPDATLGGNPGYRALVDEYPQLRTARFAEAVAGTGLVVNAISGPACVAALSELAGVIGDRVVVDISSPFDFADPDAHITPVETDSLGEQVQRALPEARVVKTLNTLSAAAMVRPVLAGRAHSAFLSGDDEQAKERVSELLRDLGWRDVIDLGGIRTARGTEMMLRMWLELAPAIGTHVFGFSVVR